MNKAIFLDLSSSPEDAGKEGNWLADAEGLNALQSMQAKGYLFFLVFDGNDQQTNQDSTAASWHNLIANTQIKIDGIYNWKDHNPYKNGVSKYSGLPFAALFLRAAHDANINLPASWVITFSQDGIEAARKAGCNTVLVGNVYHYGSRNNEMREADFHATDIIKALQLVVERSAIPFGGDGTI